LAKVIINHAGSAPDRNSRVWICLKSQEDTPSAHDLLRQRGRARSAFFHPRGPAARGAGQGGGAPPAWDQKPLIQVPGRRSDRGRQGLMPSSHGGL